MPYQDDDELFTLMKEKLYTPVIGDILDQFDYAHQFLPQSIHPIGPENILAGRAMPVLMIDVYGAQKKPFGLLTEALDDLRKNEIYVASGGELRCAYWGELLTAAARSRGAAGAVINGWHRDTPQVLSQHWPVFSRGAWAPDSAVRTQVADFRCTIEVGGVTVRPGDLIFGDIDGVLVIPGDRVEEVIQKSLEKVQGEKKVRKSIEGGMTATEAFRVYGIL